jgi:hypothetical protein
VTLYKLVRHRRQVFPFRFYSRTKKAVASSYILPTLVSYWSSFFVCVSLRVCVCDTQKHQKKKERENKIPWLRAVATTRAHSSPETPSSRIPPTLSQHRSTALRVHKPAGDAISCDIINFDIIIYIYIPPIWFRLKIKIPLLADGWKNKKQQP